MRTRNICGVDRRCGVAVHSLMMSLVEKGLAKRHKRGTYLIERRAVEEVLAILREYVGVVGDHHARLFEDGGCGLDLVIAAPLPATKLLI